MIRRPRPVLTRPLPTPLPVAPGGLGQLPLPAKALEPGIGRHNPRLTPVYAYRERD